MCRCSRWLIVSDTGNAGTVWIEETKVADIRYWELNYRVRDDISWFFSEYSPYNRKGVCNCVWDDQVLPEAFRSVMDGYNVPVDLELKDKQGITYKAWTDLVLKRVFEKKGKVVGLGMEMVYPSEIEPVSGPSRTNSLIIT